MTLKNIWTPKEIMNDCIELYENLPFFDYFCHYPNEIYDTSMVHFVLSPEMSTFFKMKANLCFGVLQN